MPPELDALPWDKGQRPPLGSQQLSLHEDFWACCSGPFQRIRDLNLQGREGGAETQQERPGMVVSSCLPSGQTTGVSGQVITKGVLCDPLVINGPSQQAAEAFRGWARRKLLTGFSFAGLGIGHLTCTKLIKFNPLTLKEEEEEGVGGEESGYGTKGDTIN